MLGGSGEIRTRDQRIKSPLLYRLSYRPSKDQAPILKSQSALPRGDSWQSSLLFQAKSPLQFALDSPHH
jgi:hypothetical protein